MLNKNLEPFEEFTQARKQFEVDLLKLIREFEGKYNCMVTQIDPPERELIRDTKSERGYSIVFTSYIRTKVEF